MVTEKTSKRRAGGSRGGRKGSCGRYSRVVEHTPAAVGITRAKALTAAPILTTGLHRHSGELGQDNKRESGQGFAGHSVVPQKEDAVYQVYPLKACGSMTVQSPRTERDLARPYLSRWPRKCPREMATCNFLRNLCESTAYRSE